MSSPRVVTIEAKIVWHARKSETSKMWIGECNELNLATEAASLDELHSLIPETLHLLMIDLLEDDELDRYLRDRGWSAKSPLPTQNEDVEFQLPWQMITEGQYDPERRLN